MAKKDEKSKSQAESAAEAVQVASLAEAMTDYDQFTQYQAQSIWQYEDSGHKLSTEEQLFVRSYIIDRNPVSALRRLGHTSDPAATLRTRAQRYLNNPEVGAAVEWHAKRMMEKLDITAEKVQRTMAAIAFFDPRDVMTFDQYRVDLLHSRFWTAEQAASISSIKMGQHGVELKLYDRLRAAELLAKQIGIQPDEGLANAESMRLAADAAMVKIGQVVDRLFDKNSQEPVPSRIN